MVESGSGSSEGTIPDLEAQNTTSVPEITNAPPTPTSERTVPSKEDEVRKPLQSDEEEKRKRDTENKITKPNTPPVHTCSLLRRFYHSKYSFVCTQFVYIMLCSGAYCLAQNQSQDTWFKDIKGGKGASMFVDGVYFVVTSFTTVGFGDISPSDDGVRVVTSLLVLLGVIIMSFVYMTINEALDNLDEKIIKWYIDKERVDGLEGGTNQGVMVSIGIARRTRIKIVLAGIYALIFTVVGHLVLLKEHMNFKKMFYTTIMSQTTTGYGDIAFKSTLGRGLASVWLIIGACATSRFLDLLVRPRSHRNSRKTLHKDFSADELHAAGIHQGSSGLDFVLHRLKADKLIDDDDITNLKAQESRFQSTLLKEEEDDV